MKLGRYSCRILLLISAWSFLSHDLPAQTWTIDSYAGRSNYNISPTTVASNSGVAGIRFNQDQRLFDTSVGVPFSNQDVTWGVASIGDRFVSRRRGTLLGADASLLGHAQKDPVASVTGDGLLAKVLPLVSRNLGPAVLEFRGGPEWYGARLGTSKWTRTVWTTEFRASVQPAERLRFEGEVKHDRSVSGEDYTRGEASLSAQVGRLSVRASLGRWFGNSVSSDPEWESYIGIPITPELSIFTSARHETFDSIFLSSSRTSWNADLSFQLGKLRKATPAAVKIGENNRVVVRLALRDAGTAPSIAGDFTNWKPVPMKRYDEEWRFSTSLTSGVYRYAFLTKDGNWFVPAGMNRSSDGMGGWQAVLVVP